MHCGSVTRPPVIRSPPRIPLAGPLSTLLTIVREEGAVAPFRGVTAGLHRQFIFTGIRLGLYDQVKSAIAGANAEPGDVTVLQKVMAAVLTSSG